MIDFSLSPDELRFRDDLRDWLEESLPPRPGWGGSHAASSPETSVEVRRQWDRALYEGGYAGFGWPAEYGGRSITPSELIIFYEELTRARAPEQLNRNAKLILGPILIRYGSDEQRERFLRRILTAEDVWCQGFSEPEAGSDLASVRTRGRIEGSSMVIDGQKVWTSNAQVANWNYALVRTDPYAPKRDGISLVLVDMATPGISTSPIKQITGESEFSEVFYEGVRVPLANVVGPLNGGWPIARRLLGYERGANQVYRSGQYRVDFARLIELVAARAGGDGPEQDTSLLEALGQAYCALEQVRYLGYGFMLEPEEGAAGGAMSSVIELFASEAYQLATETALEILSPSVMVDDGHLGSEASTWQKRFLATRSKTIAGGTSEIQRTIIGERSLRLPREP